MADAEAEAMDALEERDGDGNGNEEDGLVQNMQDVAI